MLRGLSHALAAEALLALPATASALYFNPESLPALSRRSPVVWSDFLVLDCQANLHVAVGTPIEAHVALPVLRFIANAFADRVRERAACVKARKCPSLSDVDVETFLVPSVAMALDSLRAPENRSHLPPACMASQTDTDGLPAFGSSFWSDASVVTLLGSLSKALHAPAFLHLPPTCSYKSWVAGQPCTLQVDAGSVAGTQLQVAIGHCPAPAGTPAGARGDSALPSISISCSGAWCANLLAPCNNVGSSAECGGSGPAGTVPLVCRSLALSSLGTVVDGGFASFLSWLKIIPYPSTLATCASGALSGIESFAFELRKQLALLTGRAPPASSSPQVLAFCAPSDNDVLDVLKPWAVNELGATTSVPQTDPSGCAASGCDLLSIGDGKCQMECHTAECKWDGNDCGGAGRNRPPVVDTSLPASTTVQWADASAASPPVTDANFFEECNGYRAQWLYSYSDSGGWSATRTCICNSSIPEYYSWWFPNIQYTSSCGANCMTCPPLQRPPQPVPNALRFSGAERFIKAWDGQLPNGGGSALSPDRTSGAAWAAHTPTVLAPSGSNVPAGYEAIIQSSCSGELSFAPLNRNLGFAVSMPLLQRGVTWAATWVKRMQVCVANTLGATPLSDAQFELRWMLHHLAMWGYQLLTMSNTGSAAQSGAQTLRRKVGAANAATQGFGDPRLDAPWMLVGHEPLNTTISDVDALLLQSKWARQPRMRAPVASSCSFETASPLGSVEAAASRACSLSWAGLDSLLASPLGTVGLYGEIAHDLCDGTVLAPIGDAAQSPPNMGDGLPSLALWIKAAGTAMLRTPTPCTSSADCAGFGAGATCFDFNSLLSNSGGLRAVMPGRAKDPFSWFVTGSYVAATPAQSTCSNVEAFLKSVRSVVLSAAEGFNSAAPSPAPSTSLSFCMFDAQGAVQRAQSWWGSMFSMGSSFSRLDWPDQGATPAAMGSFSGIAPGVHLAPTSADAPLNPAVADDPPTVEPDLHFTITIPSSRGRLLQSGAGVTNGDLNKIRSALTDAINRRGFTIAPGGMIASGLGLVSGGTAVTFDVVLADAELKAQLLTQLNGGPGTLGASLGSILASSGCITSAAAAAGIPVTTAGTGAASTPSPSPSAVPAAASSPFTLPEEAYIMMGDHVAYTLQACQKRGFNQPVIACQFAKLLKIACGYENTHAAASELDLAVLLKWAEAADVSPEFLAIIAHANTAREIAVATGFDRALIELVSDRAKKSAAVHAPGIQAQTLLCGYDGNVFF